MTDRVLVEQSEGVRTLTLNRPEALNALTVPAMAALAVRLEEAAADRAVRAVVITGAGSAFSAGGDLAFLQELPGMSPARIREISPHPMRIESRKFSCVRPYAPAIPEHPSSIVCTFIVGIKRRSSRKGVPLPSALRWHGV